MFHVREQDVLTRRTLFHWYLLAFLSGCVNAGGFLACGRFVSHVTGFATLFGVEVGHGNLEGAIGIVTVPLYFLAGVIISAWLIDHQIYSKRRPHYSTAMGLVALCLLAVTFGGWLGWFSTFDGTLVLRRDYVLLALLCLASGLQNAAVTTASGHAVRTTHLTGITTDLGLGLVRQFGRHLDPAEREREKLANGLRFGKIIAFALGSAASSYFFMGFQFLGFLLPSLIAVYIAGVAYFEGLSQQAASESGGGVI